MLLQLIIRNIYQKQVCIVNTTAHVEKDKAYLGAEIEAQGEDYVLKSVLRYSPGWKAGLGNDMQISAIENNSV